MAASGLSAALSGAAAAAGFKHHRFLFPRGEGALKCSTTWRFISIWSRWQWKQALPSALAIVPSGRRPAHCSAPEPGSRSRRCRTLEALREPSSVWGSAAEFAGRRAALGGTTERGWRRSCAACCQAAGYRFAGQRARVAPLKHGRRWCWPLRRAFVVLSLPIARCWRASRTGHSWRSVLRAASVPCSLRAPTGPRADRCRARRSAWAAHQPVDMAMQSTCAPRSPRVR